MAVRAVRGAVHVDADERDLVLAGIAELVSEVLRRNALEPDDLFGVIFTATLDLRSKFPALAVRSLGILDVPMLRTEIAVPNALRRVLRLLAHAETERSRQQVRRVYLRGAAALRTDLPQ